MNYIKRLWVEISIVLISVFVLWQEDAIGQLQKLLSTAVTIAIPVILGFIASKRLGNTIDWSKVDENTKAYFRVILITAIVLGYAIVSNSFSVRLG